MSELIVYKLSLDVLHPGCRKQVNLVSGEINSRILHITLTDGAVAVNLNPVTDIAVIRGVKAGKEIVFNAATITNPGRVEYAFTEQDTAVAGDGYYEVQIIRVDEDGNRVLYSAWFKVHVGDTLYQDEKITSLSEYTALTEAVAAAHKAEENMYIETELNTTWTTEATGTGTSTSISDPIYCDKISVNQKAGPYVMIYIGEYDSEGNLVDEKHTSNGGIIFGQSYSHQIQNDGNYIKIKVVYLKGTELPEGLNVKLYLYQKRYFEENCVPKKRTIAGYDLSTDISASNIATKLFNNSHDSATTSIVAAYVSGYIKSHNDNDESHSDIRDKLKALSLRKIAGIDFSSDIQTEPLTNAIVKQIVAGGSEITPTIVPWLYDIINNNSTVAANKEASHIHDNKTLLDSLTEDDVRPYWKLIKKIKLEGIVDYVEVNGDDDKNINKYNRFRIILPIINMTATDIIWVRLYDRDDGCFNFAATTDVTSDSKVRFDIPIINQEYIYMETISRKGTNAATVACLTRETADTSSDGVVDKVRIASSFDVGTEIYIYGGID